MTGERVPLLEDEEIQEGKVQGGCNQGDEEEEEEASTSKWDTVVHLMKGNLGTGVLAMPEAFSHAGLLLGVLGTLALGALCTLGMQLLVSTRRLLERRMRDQHPQLGGRAPRQLSFVEVAEAAFREGPQAIRPYAPFMRGLVGTLLVVTQLGFCSVYLVFVADSVTAAARDAAGSGGAGAGSGGASAGAILLCLPALAALEWARSLRRLAPVSAAASLLLLAALAGTLYSLAADGARPPPPPELRAQLLPPDPSRLPLFVATAIYAFEGVGIVLPLEGRMREREAWRALSWAGMAACALLYAGVGLAGYARYGAAVHASLTLDLPATRLSHACRLAFAAAILLSYALQFYVPARMAAAWATQRLAAGGGRGRRALVTTGARLLLMACTAVVAWLVPGLAAGIALVGSVGSATLALVVPAALHAAAICGTDTAGAAGSGRSRGVRVALVADGALVLAGVGSALAGTYTALQ